MLWKKKKKKIIHTENERKEEKIRNFVVTHVS